MRLFDSLRAFILKLDGTIDSFDIPPVVLDTEATLDDVRQVFISGPLGTSDHDIFFPNWTRSIHVIHDAGETELECNNLSHEDVHSLKVDIATTDDLQDMLKKEDDSPRSHIIVLQQCRSKRYSRKPNDLSMPSCSSTLTCAVSPNDNCNSNNTSSSLAVGSCTKGHACDQSTSSEKCYNHRSFHQNHSGYSYTAKSSHHHHHHYNGNHHHYSQNSHFHRNKYIPSNSNSMKNNHSFPQSSPTTTTSSSPSSSSSSSLSHYHHRQQIYKTYTKGQTMGSTFDPAFLNFADSQHSNHATYINAHSLTSPPNPLVPMPSTSSYDATDQTIIYYPDPTLSYGLFPSAPPYAHSVVPIPQPQPQPQPLPHHQQQFFPQFYAVPWNTPPINYIPTAPFPTTWFMA